MSTHTVTVKIELPDGYEPTGEFRPVQPGEYYFDRPGDENWWETDTDPRPGDHYIIIRKREPWEPPSWLPNGCWLFQSRNGGWYFTKEEPNPDGFIESASPTVRVIDLDKAFSGWTPPNGVRKIQIKR